MTNRPLNEVPVKLVVKTVIHDGIDAQEFELTTFGHLYKKDTTLYLKYDEVLEEGDVHTVIKITHREAIIIRNGAVKMKLTFRHDEHFSSTYQSPYGMLEMVTFTKHLEHAVVNDHNGLIDLQYDLHIQGALAGTYHMTIQYQEERN